MEEDKTFEVWHESPYKKNIIDINVPGDMITATTADEAAKLIISMEHYHENETIKTFVREPDGSMHMFNVTGYIGYDVEEVPFTMDW